MIIKEKTKRKGSKLNIQKAAKKKEPQLYGAHADRQTTTACGIPESGTSNFWNSAQTSWQQAHTKC